MSDYNYDDDNDYITDDDDDSQAAANASQFTTLTSYTGHMRVDNLGNLVLKKKPRNHNDADVDKPNAIMKQGFVKDKCHNVWLGTLTHLASVRKMVTSFFEGIPNDTPVIVTIAQQNTDPSIAPPAGSGHTVPLLPYQATSGFKLPRKIGQVGKKGPVWRCGNCGRFGHELADCVLPSFEGGDVAGCPLCNTKEHLFDECNHRTWLNDEVIVKMLYQRRAGKCQIRTDLEVYVLFQQYLGYQRSCNNAVEELLELFPPWTRGYTFKILSDSDNVTYLQKFDYGDNPFQYVQPDTDLTVEDIIANPPGAAYSDWVAMKEAKRRNKGKNTSSVPTTPAQSFPPPPPQPQQGQMMAPTGYQGGMPPMPFMGPQGGMQPPAVPQFFPPPGQMPQGAGWAPAQFTGPQGPVELGDNPAPDASQQAPSQGDLGFNDPKQW
ncbi:hypothetical protein PG995_003120 [Apiospora arundinis]